MNELTTNTQNAALALINSQNETEVQAVQSSELAQVISLSYLPTMTIAYGTSEMVGEGKARPGDFTVANQTTMGPSADVIFLLHRFRMTEWDNAAKKFGDTIYHLPSAGRMADDPAWQEFLRRPRARTLTVSDGPELLLFLPKLNTFCTFFFKNTLKGGAEALITARPSRLCTLRTEYHKSKKSGNVFYSVEVTPTNRCMVGSTLQIPGTSIEYDVNIPTDLLTRAVELFNKPPAAILADSTPDIND